MTKVPCRKLAAESSKSRSRAMEGLPKMRSQAFQASLSPVVTALAGLLIAACHLPAADQLRRAPREAGEITKVQVSIQVGGDLLLKNDAAKKPLAMSVSARLDYDEYLTSLESKRRSSYRYYDLAEATIKLENGQQKPNLRDSRRLIAVQVGDGPTSLNCPSGPLTREELDLVDVQGNSLLFDDLLPPGPVSVNDTWKPSDETIAALLDVEVASVCEAECVLGEITPDGVAKIAMAGTLQGAVGGVPTEIEFKSKYEAQNGRVSHFALLVKEKRAVGHVAPGLDVVAKIIVHLTPLEKSRHLSQQGIADLPAQTPNAARSLVFWPKTATYQLQYDRRWFLTSEQHELAVLRLMDRGEYVAQCNLSELPSAAGNERARGITLEEFQRDVQLALGKKFGQFVQATEAEGPGQVRTLRVAVQGEEADLPIRWIYYLLVGPQGSRISLAFTLEDKLVDRFGSADQELVSKLRLSDRPVEEARRP